MGERNILGRGARVALLIALALPVLACGGRTDVRLARRILDTYRHLQRARPLPASQMMRLSLSSDSGAQGTAEIDWDGARYRENRSSAGLSIVRGIQSGKAYFTDEDGVTRVVSEPVLSELITRSYFWRRAWLFEDLEHARIELGPADGRTVSVTLTPREGNPLLLTFSRDGHRLVSARSPGFAFAFRDERHFRDDSLPQRSWNAEVRWIGLPVATLPDAEVGGWLARWGSPSAETELQRSGVAVLFPAKITGSPIRVALDADSEGPLRVSRAVASRLKLEWKTDVSGRRVARGATLEIGGLSLPGLSVEQSEPEFSADAVVGGPILRESILELDPESSRLRLHDPARWAPPDGFFRVVLDDDGNRPVGVWNRGSRSVRLVTGVPLATSLTLAPAAMERLGLSEAQPTVSGFHWGAAHFPALQFAVDRSIEAGWGEDGRIALELLLRYHVFLDLPRRWIYLRPVKG